MTAFTDDEEETRRLDWRILADGGITVYLQKDILNEDLSWLRNNGYLIYSFDSKSWESERDMHEDLSQGLSFPAYYGMNWNALNECLMEDLIVPSNGGVAVVMDNFDAELGSSSAGPIQADTLLSIFARASRHFLLTGRRLVLLLRTDNPRLHFEGLDARCTKWNSREWLFSARGL